MNYTPTTIETLKGYLGTGLKFKSGRKSRTSSIFDFGGLHQYHERGMSIVDTKGFCYLESKPILYPLSCLTEEITVPNYNDGKPFIPIVEIAKQTCPWADEITSTECGYDESGAYSNILSDGVVMWSITFNGESFFCEIEEYRMMINQMKCFQLLQKFFINYQNLDAINPFDLPENPYKK